MMIGGIGARLAGLRNPLTKAKAAQWIYDNYNIAMSNHIPSGTVLPAKTSRIQVPSPNSSGRNQVSYIRSYTKGSTTDMVVNDSIFNTVILQGITVDAGGGYTSGLTVNGVSYSLSDVYFNGINDGGPSYFATASYAHIQGVRYADIGTVSATFPGSSDNHGSWGTIYVLPGKWKLISHNVGSVGANLSDTFSENDIGLLSGGHENDSSTQEILVSVGTAIGQNHGNWYGGGGMGLMYSSTAQTVTITPNGQTETILTVSRFTMEEN